MEGEKERGTKRIRNDYKKGCIDGYAKGYNDGWFDSYVKKSPWNDKPDRDRKGCSHSYRRGFRRGYRDGRNTCRIFHGSIFHELYYYEGFLQGFDKGYDLGGERTLNHYARVCAEGRKDEVDEMLEMAGYTRGIRDSEWVLDTLCRLKKHDGKTLKKCFGYTKTEDILNAYSIRDMFAILKDLP